MYNIINMIENVLLMLKKRGHQSSILTTESYDDCTIYQLDIDTIVIIYLEDIRKKQITFLQSILLQYAEYPIILTSNKISNPVKGFIVNNTHGNVEYISNHVFTFCRYDSNIVPNYSIVETCIPRGIKKEHLPVMKKTDIMAMYMGFKSGQIIEDRNHNILRRIE